MRFPRKHQNAWNFHYFVCSDYRYYYLTISLDGRMRNLSLLPWSLHPSTVQPIPFFITRCKVACYTACSGSSYFSSGMGLQERGPLPGMGSGGVALVIDAHLGRSPHALFR